MQPAVGPWRVVRAAFVAGVCVWCSLAAHLLAGGGMPDQTAVAVSCAVVGLVAYGLSGTRWTFGRLLLVLGGGQLVLHPFFDRFGGGGGTEPAPMAVAHLVVAVGLALGIAYGDRVLWRLAAVVQALLRPLAGIVCGVGVVPVAAVARRPVAADVLDVAVPPGIVVAPSAERAPPAHSC